MIQLNSKNSSNNPKIEFKNGRLNTVRLFALANQTTAKCQQYDILFKDITLGLSNGHWNERSSNKCSVRTLYVDGIEKGVSVFPQLAKDDWEITGCL